MLEFLWKKYQYLKHGCLFFLLLCISWTTTGKNLGPDSLILIISSYNPETSQTSRNISEFLDEYNASSGKSSVAIENMNCKSFSEACSWKSRMKDILAKYTGKSLPKTIILLGQEAWTSYLSQDSLTFFHIPIIGGMVSRNAVLLPEDGTDLENWESESVDVVNDSLKNFRILGFAYEYDVEKNIELILDFYPDTKHIAFISDNTYGGVSLQALVKKKMREKYPDLELILLDGRKHTVYSITERISTLPEHTAILLGTWRVDKNDGYFMRNATYSMMMTNPGLPAFTVTSIGMGYWATGGCVPEYRTVGKDIARLVIGLENQSDSVLSEQGLQIIPNQYCFDYEKLRKGNFLNKEVAKGALFYNKKLSYFEEYKYQIIGVALAFILLLLGFVLAMYFYLRTKRFKDALVEAQKDNTLILNNVNTGIKFINPDFTIKWHNGVDFTALMECVSNSKGEVCYKALRNLDQPCPYCPAVTAMRTGKVADTIVKQGNYYIYILANPVFDEEKNLLGVVMRLEDMTKQKQIEIELRQAKERAEESDRLKSAFLANMSHEIRTPLNAIVGFSGVLVADDYDVATRREFVEIIQKNSDLLLRLINDILDISRLETGRLKFSFEETELVSLCQSVLATTSYGKKDGVEYVFKAPCEQYMLRTDVQRLQQILINLLSNANKFTPRGSITLAFEVDEKEDCIYFSVTDTGCGIPEEKQKKVFERFEKLDEYVQGTGLGLAICKLTITMMGGDIWIDKNYTEGARFVVRHPLNVKLVSEE
ncbi:MULTISPECIES: HAMP domain-containing sensor histidine kinase [unclassified Butyricimonas]|uniref:sensor histidine kinase n=1 Tax=unclassified Butyricimonas TaxID=2637652 RepID=UPI000C0739CA|nr:MULTISPECIES: HAMP domain-containing sensor histidine kinase [unclassified Butyricimonas]